MSRKRVLNCPFCKPPADAVIAQSRHFIALYNIAPILPGHSLVVPKRHTESLMNLRRSTVGEMLVFARDVVEILGRAFNASGFNWTLQEKEEAGQTVPHLHMHIIPRKVKDLPQPGDWYPLLQQSQSEVIDSALRPRLTPDQIRDIVRHIRRYKK